MSENPSSEWQVLDERVVYEHQPWLKLIEQDIRLPNGHVIEKYLLSETPEVVMIFALTAAGELLLVEQYKHGMGQLSLDLCAGYMDPEDATPLAAAQRELAEETGYASESWHYLASLVVSPNRSASPVHYFAARNCRQIGDQHLDPTEDLSVQTVSPHMAAALIQSGRVRTLATAAGILLGLQFISSVEGSSNPHQAAGFTADISS